MGPIVLSFLVYLFPKQVVAQVVVNVLGKLAQRTENTIDDEIVKIVSDGLGLAKDE